MLLPSYSVLIIVNKISMKAINIIKVVELYSYNVHYVSDTVHMFCRRQVFKMRCVFSCGPC